MPALLHALLHWIGWGRVLAFLLEASEPTWVVIRTEWPIAAEYRKSSGSLDVCNDVMLFHSTFLVPLPE